MHSIVTTFREAVIKVEVANFGAAIDTLIDQDDRPATLPHWTWKVLVPIAHLYNYIYEFVRSNPSHVKNPGHLKMHRPGASPMLHRFVKVM